MQSYVKARQSFLATKKNLMEHLISAIGIGEQRLRTTESSRTEGKEQISYSTRSLRFI